MQFIWIIFLANLNMFNTSESSKARKLTELKCRELLKLVEPNYRKQLTLSLKTIIQKHDQLISRILFVYKEIKKSIKKGTVTEIPKQLLYVDKNFNLEKAIDEYKIKNSKDRNKFDNVFYIPLQLLKLKIIKIVFLLKTPFKARKDFADLICGEMPDYLKTFQSRGIYKVPSVPSNFFAEDFDFDCDCDCDSE